MEKIRVVLQLLLVLLSIVFLVAGICQGRIDFLLLAIAGLILSRSLSVDNIKHQALNIKNIKHYDRVRKKVRSTRCARQVRSKPRKVQ